MIFLGMIRIHIGLIILKNLKMQKVKLKKKKKVQYAISFLERINLNNLKRTSKKLLHLSPTAFSLRHQQI